MNKWKISKKGQKWESHEYEGDILRYSIHHHIDYAPEQLLLSCYNVFGSRQVKLESKEIEQAKHESLALIKLKLIAMLNDLPVE